MKHIDAIVDDIHFDETIRKLVLEEPRVILVNPNTPNIESDIRIDAEVKKALPISAIACVGTFPSKNVEEFFRINSNTDSPFDLVLRGKYEETALGLAYLRENNQPFSSIERIA